MSSSCYSTIERLKELREKKREDPDTWDIDWDINRQMELVKERCPRHKYDHYNHKPAG